MPAPVHRSICMQLLMQEHVIFDQAIDGYLHCFNAKNNRNVYVRLNLGRVKYCIAAITQCRFIEYTVKNSFN